MRVQRRKDIKHQIKELRSIINLQGDPNLSAQGDAFGLPGPPPG